MKINAVAGKSLGRNKVVGERNNPGQKVCSQTVPRDHYGATRIAVPPRYGATNRIDALSIAGSEIA